MATARSSRSRFGNDEWSLFLRHKHAQDRFRRLRNDFRNCFCPPECRRGPRNDVPVDPTSLPSDLQPLHGPYVAADSEMPRTRARPADRRKPSVVVVAEARGTSDILLHRGKIRATLRMSLQVYEDPLPTGFRGYFGEMFLTRSGQEEQFIGFIHGWRVKRNTDDWEDLLLQEEGEKFGDAMPISDMRIFFHKVYLDAEGDTHVDVDGNIVPGKKQIRRDIAAPWARLGDNTDMVYIPLIWLDKSVCTAPPA